MGARGLPVKYKFDSSLNFYKVYLVAKGYTQRFGLDYLEMFALITIINTLDLLFA